jgi:hypothetical protein
MAEMEIVCFTAVFMAVKELGLKVNLWARKEVSP